MDIGMVASVSATILPRLPRQTYEEVYRNGPDTSFAGVSQVMGIATPEPAGFRVNGRWPFASGCEDADWIAGFCMLSESKDPASAPAKQNPKVIVFCMPARYWQIEDTWQAPGLRATGSHHVVLKDVFVPAANVVDMSVAAPFAPGPLYGAPMQWAALIHGPFAVGLAQGALDDVVGIAQSGKTQQRAATPMRDSEIFQYELGRAQAEYRAAEAMLEAQTVSHWRHALAGELADDALFTQATQSMIWITEACQRVTETCFSLAGAAALSTSSPLQRRLRDIQTAALHVGIQPRHYAMAGRHLLSRPHA
jgi:indole-3-acetate monooxygenase